MNEVIDFIIRQEDDSSTVNLDESKGSSTSNLNYLVDFIRSKTDVILGAAGTVHVCIKLLSFTIRITLFALGVIDAQNDASLRSTTNLLRSIAGLSPQRHTYAMAILLSIQSTVPIHISCLETFFLTVNQFYSGASKEYILAAAQEGNTIWIVHLLNLTSTVY